MKRYRYNSKNKNNRHEKIGFFTAFSVCMVAIGLGLWSTYASIGGLKGNVPETTVPTYTATISGDDGEAVDKAVEGVTIDMDATETTVLETQITTTETAEETELPDAEFFDDEEDKLQTILQITSSLLYPVASERVVKEYSEQPVYNETMSDYRAHTGTDFEADEGEAVFAVCDGIIDDISYDDMYGNIIKITNGVYSVYYFGVGDEMVMHEGDSVAAGDVIAKVGAIPCESEDEPHIHIEVRVSGNSIDPMTVISNDK